MDTWVKETIKVIVAQFGLPGAILVLTIAGLWWLAKQHLASVKEFTLIGQQTVLTLQELRTALQNHATEEMTVMRAFSAESTRQATTQTEVLRSLGEQLRAVGQDVRTTEDRRAQDLVVLLQAIQQTLRDLGGRTRR